jgi:hypothetical protein
MNLISLLYNPTNLLRSILLLALPAITSVFARAQELSNIGKSPLLTTSGGISLNQVYYSTGDTLSQRNPYSYTLMANLSLSVYGWSVPLSAVYSNRQWSYHQPFNQFSLHPSYKWIRLHAGYSSMNFSPYTLGGHQFLGGGIELTPDNGLKFSAMIGRLQKRILKASAMEGEPAYKRIGTGFKAEYANNFGSIAIILFYATDDKNSLPVDDSLTITPQENLTLGFGGNVNINRSINASLDYSRSILSENTFSPKNDAVKNKIPFYNYRESTRRFNALKASLNYSSFIGVIGVGYERIDPGYRTLGAYYNNNDFVNYTLNYGGSFLKNRMSLAASFGMQRDNLNGQKEQENTRTIGNLNINLSPIESLGISLFYSNFYNFTNIKTTFENINTTNPYGHLDTLGFTQISKNLGGSFNLGLRNKDKVNHAVNLTLSYQEASQTQTDNPEQAGSKFYTAVAGYNLRYVPADLAPSLMFNYSRSVMDSVITCITGPSFSIRKSFLNKKMNLSAMLSYNHSSLNGQKQGENTLLRLSVAYNIKKSHQFDLSCITAWRNNIKRGKSNELTIMLTYRYNFSWTPVFKSSVSKKENHNESL